MIELNTREFMTAPMAFGAALAFFASTAAAHSDLSLPLELGPEGEVTSVAYKCEDGTNLTVQYVNAGRNALALIPLKGETVIFASVISGSGARYVSGPNVWWDKGKEASMSDETGDAKPVTCTASTD